MREDLHRLADSGACGDNVLDDYDLLAGSGNVANEYAALAVILNLFSVEEEGNVETLLGECNRRGNRERDALVCRTVENRLLLAETLEVCLRIEFTESGDVRAGLNHTCIDEVGDLTS